MEPRFSATRAFIERDGNAIDSYVIFDRSKEAAVSHNRDYAYMIVDALNALDKKQKENVRNVGSYLDKNVNPVILDEPGWGPIDNNNF